MQMVTSAFLKKKKKSLHYCYCLTSEDTFFPVLKSLRHWIFHNITVFWGWVWVEWVCCVGIFCFVLFFVLPSSEVSCKYASWLQQSLTECSRIPQNHRLAWGCAFGHGVDCIYCMSLLNKPEQQG